jgi:hypothetical protein
LFNKREAKKHIDILKPAFGIIRGKNTIRYPLIPEK